MILNQPPTTNHQTPDFRLKLIADKSITYLTSLALQEQSIFLAFTTRHGGYSKPPFDSLNLALHVNDDRKKVLKNRRLVSKSLGFKSARITCAEQVHGTGLRFVAEEEAGAGCTDYGDAIKAADGLITGTSNIPLSLFFADCLPVVVVSLKPKIVSIAHAGHKGVLNGIIGLLIKQISKQADTQELLAFLGPSIGSCCYRVGQERIDQFARKFPEVVNKNGKTLDLKAVASYQLLEAGLRPENIVTSSYCTCCNNDLFFSYRKSKETGRQAGIALIMG